MTPEPVQQQHGGRRFGAGRKKGKKKPINTHGGFREGAGRHEIPLDPNIVEALASVGATQEEIAAALGVTRLTIQHRLDKPEFAEAIERGQGKMRLSIRRQQMKVLEKGNPTMCIWMGKVHLGQRDTDGSYGYTQPKAAIPEWLAQQLSQGEPGSAIRSQAREDSTDSANGSAASAVQSDQESLTPLHTRPSSVVN